jgi:hypothetical protein
MDAFKVKIVNVRERDAKCVACGEPLKHIEAYRLGFVEPLHQHCYYQRCHAMLVANPVSEPDFLTQRFMVTR